MEVKKQNQHEEKKEAPEAKAADAKASFGAKAGAKAKEEPRAEQSPEPVEARQEPEGAIDTVEDLKLQLDAQSDRYLRLMAEFDNFKKRALRDYERSVELANEKLIGELIEVRENFERALKAGEPSARCQGFLDGMRLIFAKFDGVLKKNGLEPFGAEGEPFDPQLHDALMKIAHDSIGEDHIGEVFEKGYRLKQRVIKHAKVVVSSGAVKGDSAVDTKGEEPTA